MNPHTQYYVFDWTLSVDKSTEDETEIIKELELIAKKWCFQKEKPYEEDGDYNSEEESDEESQEGVFEMDEEYESDETTLDTDTDTDEELMNEYEDSDINSNYDEYEEDDEEEIDEFQSEYVHWQGRLSLQKKMSKNSLLKMLRENNCWLQKAHFSVTSTCNHGNVFYTMKLYSRLEGPYRDDDEKPIPIPFHLRHIELYPWQQELLDRCMYGDVETPNNNRIIQVVFCPNGNTGKSTLAMYCKCNKIMNSLIIPSIMDSFLDLNQAVLSQCYNKKEQPELLFLDIPRALPKNKMNSVIAFLEQAKSYVFDTRYKYSEMIFLKPPAIVVFTNVKIWENRDLLTNDRWKIWKIKNNCLFKYTEDEKLLEKGPDIIYPESEEEESDEEEECELCNVDERGKCDKHFTVKDFIKNEGLTTLDTTQSDNINSM